MICREFLKDSYTFKVFYMGESKIKKSVLCIYFHKVARWKIYRKTGNFDEINFDELLDIFIEKVVIWVY